jgi:hypothetical protein
MRNFLFWAFALLSISLCAQGALNPGLIERKGFSIGFELGAGALTLNTNDTVQTAFSATLPNIRVGYMVNQRLVILVLFLYCSFFLRVSYFLKNI